MMSLFFLMATAGAQSFLFCSQHSAKGELCLASVESLRPTQFAAGYLEVKTKEQMLLRKRKDGELGKYLVSHPVPAVIGPDGRIYLVDGHHFSLACSRIGVETVLVDVVKNWKNLKPEVFWQKMQERGWVYLKRLSKRLDVNELPARLDQLVDDPYRSLAAGVRKAKGFKKAPQRFSEFAWADFFRLRIPLEMIIHEYSRAIQRGAALAKSREARDLPGWSPDSDCESKL